MPTSTGDRARAPAPAPGISVVLAAGAAGVALVVGLGLAGTGGSASIDGPPGTASVVEIIDGDTLVVDLGRSDERVRLIGIDTPESVDPDRPDECFGAEASRRLAELVPPGAAVRLERDVEARDQYDRLLAYVYRADDDLFVNLAQVSGGYAETLTYPPNIAHTADFERAERQARTAGVGLWTACGAPPVQR
jgi:micrococcal nuclease